MHKFIEVQVSKSDIDLLIQGLSLIDDQESGTDDFTVERANHVKELRKTLQDTIEVFYA